MEGAFEGGMQELAPVEGMLRGGGGLMYGEAKR